MPRLGLVLLVGLAQVTSLPFAFKEKGAEPSSNLNSPVAPVVYNLIDDTLYQTTSSKGTGIDATSNANPLESKLSQVNVPTSNDAGLVGLRNGSFDNRLPLVDGLVDPKVPEADPSSLPKEIGIPIKEQPYPS
ncbi:hypothetical protein L0F63_000749, partial [Massospora cicadina]